MGKAVHHSDGDVDNGDRRHMGNLYTFLSILL